MFHSYHVADHGSRMPDFLKRRKLARTLDRHLERLSAVEPPPEGWIAAMRQALGMTAEQVARRKGVSRNAVYQAERSEKEGSVSLKQMDRLARAMGGRFVYAIIPDAPIDVIKHRQALQIARIEARKNAEFATLSQDDKQDMIDDIAAMLLHDMPPDFWDVRD